MALGINGINSFLYSLGRCWLPAFSHHQSFAGALGCHKLMAINY